MVGVEVCGRGGGVWEVWRCMEGGVEVCGRVEVWGEGWRCVGRWRYMGGVEECSERGGGMWQKG